MLLHHHQMSFGIEFHPLLKNKIDHNTQVWKGEAGEALMDHSMEGVLLGVEGEERLVLLVC